MVLEDPAGAGQVYRKACDELNCERSCSNYARLARLKADRALTHRYNDKGCRLGRAEACFGAGLACLPGLDDSLFVRLDLAAGLDYLERGCRLGSAESCYLVGGLHLTGMPGLTERDLTSVFKYDFMACQLGQRLACANLSGELAVHPPKSGRANDPAANGYLWRMMQLKVDRSIRSTTN